jgi:hypothetical protein
MPVAPLTSKFGSAAAGLGVAHGRRAVAVYAAKVALAVHQGMAHGKFLGHAHHGHIDRLVAMGVVLAHRLSDDAGRFLVGPVVAQAHVVHGVQNAPLYRFEPVLDPGQRPVGDCLDGVLKVSLFQVCGQRNRFG